MATLDCYVKGPVSDRKSLNAFEQKSCVGKLHFRKTPNGFVN